MSNKSDREKNKIIQQNLKELGYNPGPIDGIPGRRTRDAVAAFQTAYLVDGLVDDVTESTLEAAIKAWTQKDIKFIIPRPHKIAGIREQFGEIEYEEAKGGYIVITNDWADRNIIQANLPIVGVHQIHRKMEQVFKEVLKNIKDKGLDGEIKQFGVWSPRHKMHNPNRSLSTHSWGIACDINQATNMPGRIGDIDRGIVESFERFGLNWGGRWRYRDDMHFQYCTGH